MKIALCKLPYLCRFHILKSCDNIKNSIIKKKEWRKIEEKLRISTKNFFKKRKENWNERKQSKNELIFLAFSQLWEDTEKLMVWFISQNLTKWPNIRFCFCIPSWLGLECFSTTAYFIIGFTPSYYCCLLDEAISLLFEF